MKSPMRAWPCALVTTIIVGGGILPAFADTQTWNAKASSNFWGIGIEFWSFRPQQDIYPGQNQTVFRHFGIDFFPENGHQFAIEGPFAFGQSHLSGVLDYAFLSWRVIRDGTVVGWNESSGASGSTVPTGAKWYGARCAEAFGLNGEPGTPCCASSTCHNWEFYYSDFPSHGNETIFGVYAPFCQPDVQPPYRFKNYTAGVTHENGIGTAQFPRVYEYRTGYTMGTPDGRLGSPTQVFHAGPHGFRTGGFRWEGNNNWYSFTGMNATASFQTGSSWASMGPTRGTFWPFLFHPSGDVNVNYVDSWVEN